MNVYAKIIKRKLDKSIDKLTRIIPLFSKNPGKDFTRSRKLPIKKLIQFLIFMGGNTQTKELLEHFKFSIKTPTSSAFIQQRNKLIPKSLGFILSEFVSSIKKFKKFKGYRLIAVDGTKVSIPVNPKDKDSYAISNKNSKGFNLLHVNALYDILNKIYLDAIIQPYRKTNEYKALVDMTNRSDIKGKVILLADRGYESYNNIATLEKKNLNYVIRVKAPSSKTGILSKTDLPINEECDEIISVLMTRRQTKEIKSKPKLYRFLSKSSTFDFLPLKSKDTYRITFRVVCVKITDDTYEYLITNLDREEFSLEDLKGIYKARWGIEISFRELKYTVGMTRFHSKKVDHIKQEIYAKLILYNFCEMITLDVIIEQNDYRKYIYKVNFTNAAQICIRFYRYFNDIDPPNVKALIKRYITPIRDGRKFIRNLKSQPFVSFFYRVS
ncbi:MAG: IS4 family transposase [Bacillota bacterium]|nr:IS4 family transposase [Bacillota bacterium]